MLERKIGVQETPSDIQQEYEQSDWYDQSATISRALDGTSASFGCGRGDHQNAAAISLSHDRASSSVDFGRSENQNVTSNTKAANGTNI